MMLVCWWTPTFFMSLSKMHFPVPVKSALAALFASVAVQSVALVVWLLFFGSHLHARA